MNRLVIIGNGFDLSHGLKTSYKDFIIWYLANCFYKNDPYSGIYSDHLINLKININYFKGYIRQNINGSSQFLLQEEEVRLHFNNLFENGKLCEFLGFVKDENTNLNTVNYSENFSTAKKLEHIYQVKINSPFLKSLIINCQDCNWVDIENEYFDQLKSCKSKDNKFDIEKVKKLNSEFTYLKTKLEAYLKLQQEQVKIKSNYSLVNAINADFDITDFEPLMGYENAKLELGYDKTIKSEILHKLYFLNFNYTNTVEAYVANLRSIRTDFSKIDINYIHGQLDNADNPIIFGFGDEHDKNYLEFEEHRNNELFDHIKSFQYLRTPHYRNLLKFLNRGNYQVFVMGHSCGLSDRTMFKEIFEHENCKSIRLFHYNGDFHDKVINVSKHFSNKGLMRKLIVDYKSSDAFPQSAQS